MSLKRVAFVLGLTLSIVAAIEVVRRGSVWVAKADESHEAQVQVEQRTLPQINLALDRITKKLEHEDLKIEHERHLCRSRKITDKEYCQSLGVVIPEGEE
jgi:hypothetical protein